MQREEGVSHQLLQAEVQEKQILHTWAVLCFPEGQGGTKSKLHLPAAWRKFHMVGKRVGLGLCFFKTNYLNSSQLKKSYFDFILWHDGSFSLLSPEGKSLQVPNVLLGRLGSGAAWVRELLAHWSHHKSKGIGVLSTWKGLWTGKGPQEEQCTQIQLRRQLRNCMQQVTVPLIKVTLNFSRRMIAGLGISHTNTAVQR